MNSSGCAGAVGFREGGARRRRSAEQPQRAVVWGEGGGGRAQPLLAAQDAGEQRDEMLAGGELRVAVEAVLADQRVEPLPGKLLHDLFEQGRLMAHGIGSAAVDNVGERRFRIRINVMPEYKHKMCRTTVGQARP
jgi:hypothetical protein